MAEPVARLYLMTPLLEDAGAFVPVLQHRVIPTPEREMEGVSAAQIVRQIVERVEVPR